MITGTFVQWSWTAPDLPIDSWWFCAIVLILLMFFIWLIARLTTSSTEDIDPAEIDRQMLTAVNELNSQGELSSEEYRSIKGRLVERLRKDSSGSADSSRRGMPKQENEGDDGSATETSEGITKAASEEGEGDFPASEAEITETDKNDQ